MSARSRPEPSDKPEAVEAAGLASAVLHTKLLRWLVEAAAVTSDVCYDKIPTLYEKHAKKYVDAALIEIGERKALATVELRELLAHAQQALHDRVQQLKEKLPTEIQ